MNKNSAWKTLGTVILVFLGGLAIIFASFAFLGFPFPAEPVSQIIWIELVFLLLLLGLPLFS